MARAVGPGLQISIGEICNPKRWSALYVGMCRVIRDGGRTARDGIALLFCSRTQGQKQPLNFAAPTSNSRARGVLAADLLPVVRIPIPNRTFEEARDAVLASAKGKWLGRVTAVGRSPYPVDKHIAQNLIIVLRVIVTLLVAPGGPSPDQTPRIVVVDSPPQARGPRRAAPKAVPTVAPCTALPQTITVLRPACLSVGSRQAHESVGPFWGYLLLARALAAGPLYRRALPWCLSQPGGCTTPPCVVCSALRCDASRTRAAITFQ
jgi:hypothetical protein